MPLMLLCFPGRAPDLFKAYIHGHYRLNRKTGQRVWIDSYTDKRPERGRTEFAHWQHRIGHFQEHLARGRLREAMHAFHDLGHDDTHKLAVQLGVAHPDAKGTSKADLLSAVHDRIKEKGKAYQAKIAGQVKADWERRKAAGTAGRKPVKVVRKPAAAAPERPPVKLSSRARRALDMLRDGGYFRQELETDPYTRREQFKTRLRDKSGRAVSGIGFQTQNELQQAGFLRSRPTQSGSTWPSEWGLVDNPPPVQGEAKAAEPESFVAAPSGGLDFGQVPADAAQAIGQAPGPIRLQLGQHDDATGRGFGKVHMDRKMRAEQLAQNGYASTEALVEDVGHHFNAVHQGKGGTYILAVRNGKAKIAFVTVKRGADGVFYSVGSGLVSRDDYLKGKPRLWERAQTNQPKPPSAISGQQPGPVTSSIADSGTSRGGPRDGDRNAEGLVFRNGRWHRDDPPDLTLTGETPADLQRKEAEAKARQQAEADAERKAAADRQRDDFVLTGSNRPADELAARGQRSLFDDLPGMPAAQPAPAAADARLTALLKTYAGDQEVTPAELAEAVRQYRAVEDRYADVLRAHDQEGKPLPAPNGQPSNLNREQWVLVRTPNFKRWFGNWQFDATVPVTMVPVRGDEIPVALDDSAALRRWLLSSPDFKTSAVNRSNDVPIGFSTRGLKDSLKRKGEAQRSAYAVLRTLVETAHAIDYTPSHDAGIAGQDIYVGGLVFGGRRYAVRIKADVRHDRSTAYKDHKAELVEHLADIEVTPAVNKGGTDGALDYPDATGPTRSGVTVSLGDLIGPDKPAASQVIDANGEPLVVYQGGKIDVSQFDNKRTQAEGNLHFFTDSPDLASVYAEHGGLPRKAWQFGPDDLLPSTRSLFISMRQPVVADARGGTKDDVADYYDMVDSVRFGRRVRDGNIQELGEPVDGLIVRNVVDMPNAAESLPTFPATLFAVYQGAQIKSASGNAGTFRADLDHVAKALSAERGRLLLYFPGWPGGAVRKARETTRNPMHLLYFPALAKAYVHGHYRTNKKTGAQVWVDSYSDKRSTKTGKMEFAHWNHRKEHVRANLAHGHVTEALHAFHDLNHEDAHRLATDLGLHDGATRHKDKKALMNHLHGRLMDLHEHLKAKVKAQEAARPASAAGRSASAEKPKPKRPAKPRTTEPPAPATPAPDDQVLDIAGEEVPFAWKLVDADDLAPTEHIAENQLRDRTRAASTEQVAAMAGNLKFRLLADSPLMDYGAPVLAKDGKTIIGGNGRTLAIRRAYAHGQADQYRADLAQRAARFGLDPKAVAKLKAPVLVRVLAKDVDVKQAAIASNEGGGARMSGLEQARVDGERLGDLEDLAVTDDGDLNTVANRPFIRRFLSAVPVAQRPAFQAADGDLSQEGITRLRNAVLYRAYGASDTLARMVESTDAGQRNVLAALVKLAPTVAQVRADVHAGRLHALDIAPDIVAATATLAKVRGDKTFGSVDEYLRQGGLFGDDLSPEAALILRHFDTNLRSAKAIGGFLLDYYAAVRAAGDPHQGGLFDDPAPDKAHLLRHTHERHQKDHQAAPQGDLFKARGQSRGRLDPARRARPARDDGSAGRGQEGPRAGQGLGRGVRLLLWRTPSTKSARA